MTTIAHFRISSERAKSILRDVERAVSTWREAGKALGMTGAELDLFADAFEHEELEHARRTMV